MRHLDIRMRVAMLGIAAILAAAALPSLLGMPPSSKAFAQEAQVLDIETVPLEGRTLAQGEFLLLADTTPANIESGHLAMNVPCTGGGGTPTSDIVVMAGVAPNMVEVDLQFVPELSNPAGGKCTFHVDIPQGGASTTDVAIANSGNQTVRFESGNFAAISIRSLGAAVAGQETVDQTGNMTDQAGNTTEGLTAQERLALEEGATTGEEQVEDEAGDEDEDEDEDEEGDEDEGDEEDTDEGEEDNGGEETQR